MAYLKWQDVAKYLTPSASLILVIIGILNLSGMSHSIPSDIICGNDCYSQIQVNSTYWEVCVEHSGNQSILYKKVDTSRRLWVNLDRVADFIPTNPEVNVELLIPTTKAYSTINNEFGYLRPVKDGDCIIKRQTLSNPSGSRFIIHGSKDTFQTVKWGLDLESLLMQDIKIDPKWIGEEKVELINTIYHPDYDEEIYSDSSTKWSFIGQGLRNIYEDGKWKKAEDARSWKDYLGYIEKLYLEKDPDFDMEILDINATFLELNLTFNPTNNITKLIEKYPECGESKTNDIKCDFKFAVKEEVCSECLEDGCTVICNKTETKFQYKYQLKNGVLKEDLKYAFKGNPFDREFTFGGNSTTIKFNKGNVTDDSHIYQAASQPNSDYGGDDDLVAIGVAASLNFPIIKIKWNGFIPANQEILDAQLALYVEAELLDTGEAWNYDAKHVYDNSKFNISGSEWTEGTGTAAAGCAIVGLASVSPEINWTNSPNEPNIEYNNTYESRKTDVAAGVSSVWYNWTVKNMVQKEYLLGHSNITILLNVSIGAGSPVAGDCAYFTSSEGTAANSPYLNITFQPDNIPPTWSLNQTNSTTAGSWIKHSLNWTDTAQSGLTPGLSGYIFQFCNGTWNGTGCLIKELIPQTIVQDYTNDTEDIYTFDGIYSYNSQVKWNLTFFNTLGFPIVINKSLMCLYVTTKDTTTPDNDAVIYRIDDQTWTEDISATSYNAQTKASTTTSEKWNGTFIAGTWNCINITNITKVEYELGNLNATVRFEDPDNNYDGSASAVTNDTELWVRDGTFSIGIKYSSRSAATSANRPKLEVTYLYNRTTENGWINDTWTAFNSNTWSNVSKVVNSTTDAHIAWRIYANDSADNWNTSSVFTYDTTSGGTTTSTTSTTSTTTTTITIPTNCWTQQPGVLIIPSGCVYHNDTVGIIT